MKIILLYIVSFNIYADNFHYKISTFKKSKKIASRSIISEDETLIQSYDLNGNLKIEVSSKMQKLETICITDKNEKIDSKSLSDNYFKCLNSYAQIVKEQEGIVEEKTREIKQKIDLDFRMKGKNLR